MQAGGPMGFWQAVLLSLACEDAGVWQAVLLRARRDAGVWRAQSRVSTVTTVKGVGGWRALARTPTRGADTGSRRGRWTRGADVGS